MANPGSSTIIAGIGLATVFVKDIRNGVTPFLNILAGGMLIVILAGIANFSPDLANALAILYLIMALLTNPTKG